LEIGLPHPTLQDAIQHGEAKTKLENLFEYKLAESKIYLLISRRRYEKYYVCP